MEHDIIIELECLEAQCKIMSTKLRDTCFNSDRVSIVYALTLTSSIHGIAGFMETHMKEIVKQL